MKISVILPVRNEAENLHILLEELRSALRELEPYEILFVDDASSDGSFEFLSKLAQEDQHIKCLGFLRHGGKSAAISTGFSNARGDILITMDADGQDDPAELPLLLKAMTDGHLDLVSGWKRDRKDPYSKIFWSAIFNGVMRWIFRTRIHDMNCGFKAYKAVVAKDLALYGDLHRFIPILAAWSGYRVGEVAIHHRPRRHGSSKYGISRIFSAPMDLISVLFLTHFLIRPLHLFGGIGALSTLAGLGICAYLTVGWFAQLWHIADRPLILLGIMLILVGAQMFSMGLVCEMTMRAAMGPIRTAPALRNSEGEDQGKDV